VVNHVLQGTALLYKIRIIFTQDSDFLRLHATGISHSGIVYAHQKTPVGGIIRGLMLIYKVLDTNDMKNHVICALNQ
jgi:uncharacterized membrane protein